MGAGNHLFFPVATAGLWAPLVIGIRAEDKGPHKAPASGPRPRRGY